MSDDVTSIAAAARTLTDARIAGRLLEGLGAAEPTDHATAEAISDLHATQLGWDVIGWKVGCTSEHAMEILGSPGPFAGRIFAGTRYGPGVVDGPLVFPRVECEFAFEIGRSIEPRDEPWSVEEVRAATGTVSPAVELVDSRFADFTGVHYLNHVADSGANGGVVIGDPMPTSELPDLAAVVVECRVDGELTGAGIGADVLGDPWHALVWLADHVSARGIALRPGQIVMSGTCTGVADLPAGSTVRADYAGLGAVELTRAA